MKFYSQSGFSLIEVIISTIILTIWVFWVYKLIGNNMALLGKNENKLSIKTLDKNFQECLTNTLQLIPEWNFSMNFWIDNMWCEINIFQENYNFTGVTLNNQEFFLYGNKKANWDITYNIFSPETGKLNKTTDQLFINKK